MKITILYGAMASSDYGLVKLKNMIGTILEELGIKPEDINIFYSSVPYFDGIKSDIVSGLMQSIKESDGVIFASTANFSLPGALITTLLEHMSLPDFNDVLYGKNCLLAVVSSDNSFQSAMRNLELCLQNLGACCDIKIGGDAYFAANLESNPSFQEMVEKRVEDYYRIIRQQRKFYVPLPSTASFFSEPAAQVLPFASPAPEKIEPRPTPARRPVIQADPPVPASAALAPTPKPAIAKEKVEEIFNEVDIEKFSNEQKQDIQEITQFFAQKINLSADKLSVEPSKAAAPSLVAVPTATMGVNSKKSCRQLTESLIHYFQPQLSGGMSAVIQLSISGVETFEGYIAIDNTECEYHDGTAKVPDITIIATSDVWENVLTGKVTTQKAFMIGQLKVRGNFALLTKFDQLFKTEKNMK